MSMIGKANSISKIIQNGVGTATGAVGILWVSEVSLDGLWGLHTYVNRWESTDWAFPSGSPRHLWCNFGYVPIHNIFLSFPILWGSLHSLPHASGKFYRWGEQLDLINQGSVRTCIHGPHGWRKLCIKPISYQCLQQETEWNIPSTIHAGTQGKDMPCLV